MNVTSEQVPATGIATAPATETWSRAASNASVQGGDDSKEEDFLESLTGSPELERSRSETPFANLFNESRNFMVLTLMKVLLGVMEIVTLVLKDVVDLVEGSLMVVRTGIRRAILWVYFEHPTLQFVIAC